MDSERSSLGVNDNKVFFSTIKRKDSQQENNLNDIPLAANDDKVFFPTIKRSDSQQENNLNDIPLAANNDKVFFSTIKRKDSQQENNLYDILNTPPNPPFPVKKNVADVNYPPFQPQAIKIFNYTKCSKLKVKTVATVKRKFEEWFVFHLKEDLFKQKSFCLRKIMDGLGNQDKIKDTLRKILESDRPILPSTFAMLSNANVYDKKFNTHKIKCGNEIIAINGSKGTDKEFIDSSSIIKRSKNLTKRGIPCKKPSLNIFESNYKPGPLSKKPLLDNSVDKNLEGGKTDLLCLPEVILEISPRVGIPLDRFILQKLEPSILCDDGIPENWAQFSVSTLSNDRDEMIHQNEEQIFKFPISYSHRQKVILMKHTLEVPNISQTNNALGGEIKMNEIVNAVETNISEFSPPEINVKDVHKEEKSSQNIDHLDDDLSKRVLRKRNSNIYNEYNTSKIPKHEAMMMIDSKDIDIKLGSKQTVDLPRLDCSNIESFCMVHNLYKCFCKGVYTQSFVDCRYESIIMTNSLDENKSVDSLDNVQTESLFESNNQWIKSYTQFSDPLDFSTNSHNCARQKPFIRRRNSDFYYKDNNLKIKEMEQDDKFLQKKLLLRITNASKKLSTKLLSVSSQPRRLPKISTETPKCFNENDGEEDIECIESDEEPPAKENKTVKTDYLQDSSRPQMLQARTHSFKTWLEQQYKSLQEQNNINLGPPKNNQARLFPWSILLERYKSKKNYFLASKFPPMKLIISVKPFLNSYKNCVEIGELNENQLNAYPIAANFIMNVQLINCFIILKGRTDCWEIVGSVTKSTKVKNLETRTEETPTLKQNENQSIVQNRTFVSRKRKAFGQDTAKDELRIEEKLQKVENANKTENTSECDTTSTKAENSEQNNSELKKKSRWFRLVIENDFTKLQFYQRGFFVKRESIVQAISAANKTGKAVRLSSQRSQDSLDDKFGVYAVPHCPTNSVFIGPYKNNEDLGLETVKSASNVNVTPKTRGMWVNDISELLHKNRSISNLGLVDPFDENKCENIRVKSVGDTNESPKVSPIKISIKEGRCEIDKITTTSKKKKLVDSGDSESSEQESNTSRDSLLLNTEKMAANSSESQSIGKQNIFHEADTESQDLPAKSFQIIQPESDVSSLYNEIDEVIKLNMTLRKVYLESHIQTLGYIEGLRDIYSGQIRFKFPGFRLSPAYIPIEAYRKINAILSRKVFIPQLLKIVWRWTYRPVSKPLDASKINLKYALLPSAGLVSQSELLDAAAERLKSGKDDHKSSRFVSDWKKTRENRSKKQVSLLKEKLSEKIPDDAKKDAIIEDEITDTETSNATNPNCESSNIQIASHTDEMKENASMNDQEVVKINENLESTENRISCDLENNNKNSHFNEPVSDSSASNAQGNWQGENTRFAQTLLKPQEIVKSHENVPKAGTVVHILRDVKKQTSTLLKRQENALQTVTVVKIPREVNKQTSTLLKPQENASKTGTVVKIPRDVKKQTSTSLKPQKNAYKTGTVVKIPRDVNKQTSTSLKPQENASKTGTVVKIPRDVIKQTSTTLKPQENASKTGTVVKLLLDVNKQTSTSLKLQENASKTGTVVQIHHNQQTSTPYRGSPPLELPRTLFHIHRYEEKIDVKNRKVVKIAHPSPPLQRRIEFRQIKIQDKRKTPVQIIKRPCFTLIDSSAKSFVISKDSRVQVAKEISQSEGLDNVLIADVRSLQADSLDDYDNTKTKADDAERSDDALSDEKQSPKTDEVVAAEEITTTNIMTEADNNSIDIAASNDDVSTKNLSYTYQNVTMKKMSLMKLSPSSNPPGVDISNHETEKYTKEPDLVSTDGEKSVLAVDESDVNLGPEREIEAITKKVKIIMVDPENMRTTATVTYDKSLTPENISMVGSNENESTQNVSSNKEAEELIEGNIEENIKICHEQEADSEILFQEDIVINKKLESVLVQEEIKICDREKELFQEEESNKLEAECDPLLQPTNNSDDEEFMEKLLVGNVSRLGAFKQTGEFDNLTQTTKNLFEKNKKGKEIVAIPEDIIVIPEDNEDLEPHSVEMLDESFFRSSPNNYILIVKESSDDIDKPDLLETRDVVSTVESSDFDESSIDSVISYDSISDSDDTKVAEDDHFAETSQTKMST